MSNLTAEVLCDCQITSFGVRNMVKFYFETEAIVIANGYDQNVNIDQGSNCSDCFLNRVLEMKTTW